MKNKSIGIIILFTTFFLMIGCSKTAPVITEQEVVVAGPGYDVHFSRGESFTETYMLFGGSVNNKKEYIAKVSLSGLDMMSASQLFERYPDFWMCKSQGSAIAQRSIQHLQIVPVNEKILKKFEQALAAHETSLGSGGDRVSITMEGEILSISSAITRDTQQDISGQLFRDKMDYYLIDFLEITDTRAALEEG